MLAAISHNFRSGGDYCERALGSGKRFEWCNLVLEMYAVAALAALYDGRERVLAR